MVRLLALHSDYYGFVNLQCGHLDLRLWHHDLREPAEIAVRRVAPLPHQKTDGRVDHRHDGIILVARAIFEHFRASSSRPLVRP